MHNRKKREKVTRMKVEIVNKKGFKAIGVKWSGTFEQAAKGEIKNLLEEFRSKSISIKNAVNTDTILGLKYHNIENGFTIYLVIEVENYDEVPETMEVISVPAYTFVTTTYTGNDKHSEYMKLYNWIEDNGFKLNQQVLEHLEEYLIDNTIEDTQRLKLHIPIVQGRKKSSDNIVIRRAASEDASELYELMKQYIVVFYKQPEPEEIKLRNLIHHLHETPSSGIQFIAQENGELIGFATLYFTFSTLKVQKRAILNDLYVVPFARGNKVGGKLLQACVEYIRANDFSSVTWETTKDNIVAQSLFEKMGASLSEWLVYEMN